MTKKKKKQKKNWDLRSPTNFYPLYAEGKRSRVEPVSSVRSSQFQEVIPNYELSTSDTRDQGTGPPVNDLPRTIDPQTSETSSEETKEESNQSAKKPKKKKPRKGIRYDFWG